MTPGTMFRFPQNLSRDAARLAHELDNRLQDGPAELPITVAFVEFLSDRSENALRKRVTIEIALHRALVASGMLPVSVSTRAELDDRLEEISTYFRFLAQGGYVVNREEIASYRDFAIKFSDATARCVVWGKITNPTQTAVGVC